jgi:hypothetical protein
MTESVAHGVLDHLLIRLSVLARLQVGEVIVLEDEGGWVLQPSSAWQSAGRRLLALVRWRAWQPQRRVFLKSVRETIDLLIEHSSLMMRAGAFHKASDPTTQTLTVTAIGQLSSAERSELLKTLRTLQMVSTALFESLHGLYTMIYNEPYSADQTWCAELNLKVIDEIRHFLDQLYRRLDPETAKRVLPFLSQSTGTSSSSTTGPVFLLADQMAARVRNASSSTPVPVPLAPLAPMPSNTLPPVPGTKSNASASK